jgi:hypothetical protein
MRIPSKATTQESDVPAPGPLTTADLEGTWVRTDALLRGISRAVVEAAEGGLQVRVCSVEGNGSVDWGTAPVEAVYAASPEAKAGVAFTATYDLPSRRAVLHANLSKGLLIIATVTRFLDGRRGEFAREFFRKLDGPVTPGEG